MGVRHSEIVVHAGGFAVLVDLGVSSNSPVGDKILEVADDGRRAVIRCGTNSIPSVEVELDRRKGKLLVHRSGAAEWRFWYQGGPQRRGNEVRWRNGTKLIVREGEISQWSPEGQTTSLSVGNGLLPLKDPATRSYPVASIAPDKAGKILVEVR